MEKLYKKSFALLTALIFVIATVVTGCSGTNSGSSSEENVTLNVAVQKHTAVDALQQMLPEFEKKTGIKVKFDVLPQEELHSKTELALASKSDQYDVIMMDMMFTSQYAKADWIEPLNPYIEKSKEEVQIDDFMDGFLGALTVDNKIYGLPFYGESTMLMYNKEMFKKAGITKPPATMEELEEAAKKLTRDGKYGIALRGMRGEGMNIYVWAGFFNAFGGKWLEGGKPNINSPEAVKATQFYANLIRKYGPPGGANFSWDQVQLALQQGTVAMAIDATNFAPRLEDPKNSKIAGKVGYAPVPKGPAGYSPSVFTVGLVIPKASKHKDEAFEFIKWATSRDVQLKTALNGLRGDVTRKSVWEDPKFKEKYNYPGWVEVVADGMENAKPDYRPRIPEWRKMGDRLGIAVSEVIAGKHAKQALDNAQKEIETYFNK